MQLINLALAATISGLLIGPFYSIPIVSAVAGSFLCLLAAIIFRNKSLLFYLLVFAVFFLTANLRYPLEFPSVPDVERLVRSGNKLRVIGQVLYGHQLTDDRMAIDLLVTQLSGQGQVLESFKPFKLKLYFGDVDIPLLPGDRISFTARLRKPRLFGTPGEFDFPRYLASQDILLTAWLKTSDQLESVTPGNGSLQRMLNGWRLTIVEKLQTGLPAEQVPLVRALVLGESKQMPTAVRKVLAEAGISHLFAISGLHLGLIAAFGYRLLLFGYRRFPRLLNWQPPQRVLPLLLLPLLFTYMLLTGDALATRRAFYLALIGTLFLLRRYAINPMQLLASLALLALLSQPLLLWQPGWQLSFAGAAGILLWRPLWLAGKALPSGYVRAPLQLLLVSVAATLATLPLVLLNFHLLAPPGVFVNLIAVPIVTLLALPVGLFGLFASTWSTLLANTAFSFCGLLLQYLVGLCRWLTELPALGAEYLFLGRSQYLAITLLSVAVLLLVRWNHGARQRWMIGFLFLTAIGCWQVPGRGLKNVQMTLFSVGQGESILLQNSVGQAVLIDGGGLYSKRFDVGERLLAPALGELGVQEFLAVMLTHDHPDHRKGLEFLLQNFQVGEFWTGQRVEDLHPSLQAAIEQKRIPVRQFSSGWTKVNSWRHGKMEIYQGKNRRGSVNDSSLVLYLAVHDQGLLLTGDLEGQGVAELLAAGVPGPVNLLKLPHHGSRYSGTERMLECYYPESCFVSAGYQNRYGFPARQLLQELEQRHLPVYRTDQMGTVRVTITADGHQVSSWQNGLFR